MERSWIPNKCFCEILIALFEFAIKTNSIAIECYNCKVNYLGNPKHPVK